MKKDELMNLGLPKWPQMIVTGTAVSEEQALEIIRRTDDFFCWQSGNNHDFIEKAVRILKIPQCPITCDAEAFQKHWAAKEEWEKKWGLIKNEFVTNSWVSCPFVGGPHGWCHPDGSIGYSYNVGKWPSVEEVYDEWAVISEAFPFLELEVTLMNGEYCEDFTEPVISMLIRNSRVELIDPKERNLHREFGRKKEPTKDTMDCVKLIISGRSVENAISLKQLQMWSDQIFGK